MISATKVVAVHEHPVWGNLDAAVSWTHHDDVVTVAFYPSGCTAAHFGTGRCAALAQETSQTGSLSQHVGLYGGQPGEYVLGIQNLGPHARSRRFPSRPHVLMPCLGRSMSWLLVVLTACTTGPTMMRWRPPRIAPHAWTEVPTTSPATAVPPEERCSVRVCFWNMGLGFYHAYIVTSDRRGATHFRAGPAHPGPVGERLWALLRPAGSEARQWGPLRAEHGTYVPGSVGLRSG